MVASFLARLTPTDEEFAKKDDDHKPSDTSRLCFSIRRLVRVRGKRIIGTISVVVLIWFLFTHRLSDMSQWKPRNPIEYPQTNGREAFAQYDRPSRPNHRDPNYDLPPLEHPSIQDTPVNDKSSSRHYYEGGMNFHKLPISVAAIRRIGGWGAQNRIVLFSAASLRSTAMLIPMACDMAKRGTNSVHMAFMGRNELSIEEILHVNGVDADCEVVFHDARPDYAQYSTELRAEESVGHALKYLQRYLNIPVVITHSSLVEDGFFTRAVEAVSLEHGISLIQVPYQESKMGVRPQESLTWISRLDTSSLASWSVPDIEIVIQITTNTAGRLKKLLESLWEADYAGTTPPRLTVELPTEADESLIRDLARFRWPPGKLSTQKLNINVRRRIPIRSMSAEEASIRFMESFFPAQPESSHVLILSANSIVSPMFYQQLRYYILHLKHSRLWSPYPPLIGLGFNLPSMYLNQSASFTAPNLTLLSAGILQDSKPVGDAIRPHFLWQAPNTDAALYFGSAWQELHSFISLRLAKFHSKGNTTPREKLIGNNMPAWSEFVLEFMRCRGYSFFYPGAAIFDDAAVSSTTGPTDVPDEFHPSNVNPEVSYPKSASNDEPPSQLLEPFLAPDGKTTRVEPPRIKHKHGTTSPLTQQPLINTLPFQGPEPALFDLPGLTWDGMSISVDDLASKVNAESESFRQELGGCRTVLTPKGKRRKISPGNARDLFCFGDEVWEDIPATARDTRVSESVDVAQAQSTKLVEDEVGTPPGKASEPRSVGFDAGPVYDS